MSITNFGSSNHSASQNSNSTASLGLQQAEDAVTFIQQKVLNPSGPSNLNFAKPIADQAAAMMVQDLRSFLQGTEQILMVALAKAAALTLAEPTQETGTQAIQDLTKIMTELPKFVKGIGTEASTLASNFGKKSPTL